MIKSSVSIRCRICYILGENMSIFQTVPPRKNSTYICGYLPFSCAFSEDRQHLLFQLLEFYPCPGNFTDLSPCHPWEDPQSWNTWSEFLQSLSWMFLVVQLHRSIFLFSSGDKGIVFRFLHFWCLFFFPDMYHCSWGGVVAGGGKWKQLPDKVTVAPTKTALGLLQGKTTSTLQA